MTRPTVSVVFATYNRAHLLEQSLVGYNRIDFDLNQLELVVVDDDSEDYTESTLSRYLDSRINLVYIKLRKQLGQWRDCASVINVGLRACQGKVVVATHPEVIPGIQTIKSMVEHVKMNHYVCAVPWYLSPRDQERIDTVNWLGEGNHAVRKIEGFYEDRNGHPDYHPSAIDKVGTPEGHPHWLSWVMGAMTRETWSHLGGFIETTAWGAVDLIFLQRRQKLGIHNITLTGDQERVIHQNHDIPVGHFKPTERNLDECHRQAPNLTPEQCRWPHVDHLWGPY